MNNRFNHKSRASLSHAAVTSVTSILTKIYMQSQVRNMLYSRAAAVMTASCTWRDRNTGSSSAVNPIHAEWSRETAPVQQAKKASENMRKPQDPKPSKREKKQTAKSRLTAPLLSPRTTWGTGAFSRPLITRRVKTCR